MKHLEIPNDFECPISHEIMVDPVFTADGNTFEQKNIEEWLREHNTNPCTNQILEDNRLVPNRQLRSQIRSFVDKHKVEFEKELFEASSSGDNETLALILKFGISIDIMDEKGWSAIHYAAFAGMEKTVEFLLTLGAKFDRATASYENAPRILKNAETPSDLGLNLHLQLLSMEVELSQITFLCNECLRIKPVDKGGMNSDQSDKHARTMMQHDLDSIKNHVVLFQQLNQLTNSTLIDKKTPLSLNEKFAAIESNLTDCEKQFQSLLAFYSNYSNSRLGGLIGNMNQFLSSIKLDITAKLTRLKQTLAETKHAVEKQQIPEQPKPLIRLAPIHLAVISGSTATVEKLLSGPGGKELATQQTSQGWTPLHWAAYLGNLAMVESLLKNGASLNCQDMDGLSPLHIAVYQIEVKLIDYFIQNSADAEMQDKQGESPIALAKRINKNQLAQSIQQAYHQQKQQMINKLEAKVDNQSEQIARLEQQLTILMQHIERTSEPKPTDTPKIATLLDQTFLAPVKEQPSETTADSANDELKKHTKN